MAIKKTIEIDVETLKAQGGLDKFVDTLQKTEQQSVSLKAELRKLKEQLAELPEGSAEYNKIAQRAGEVSDKIGDISARVKNLGSDTKNIDAVVQGTQALSGAFSVATSASALFGNENKDLQEQMVKVESAIGLTVGIQSIANALQKESALAIGASTLATKIQTGAQVIYATVVGTTTGALKALRVALLSTGVGALVVGLGFLVAKMTEAKEATEDNEEALKSLTEAQKVYENSLKSEISGIDNSIKARVLRAKIGGASEKELREIEKNGEKERADAYDSEIKRLDKELLNKNLSNKQLKILQDQRNKLGDEAIKLAQDRDNSQLEYELTIADKKRENKKKLSAEAIAENKRLADEEKRIAKENFDLEKASVDEQLKNNKLSIDEKRNIVINDNKLSKEDRQKFLIDLQNQEIQLEEEHQKAITDLNKKYDEEKENRLADTAVKKEELDYNRRKSEIESIAQTELERQTLIEKLDAEHKVRMGIAQKTDDEKKIADAKAVEDAKVAIQLQGLNTLNDLVGLAKSLGEKNKDLQRAALIAESAIGISKIIINTQAANAAARLKYALLPGGAALAATESILNKVSAGIGIAANVAATAKGLSALGGGSAPSGGSNPAGGSGGATSTPQFNMVGQSSTNQLAQTISSQQNRPIRTYVVSGDVTTQQALDRNAVSTSTFG